MSGFPSAPLPLRNAPPTPPFALTPRVAGFITVFVIGFSYAAFQKKLLPKPLSRIAAKFFFWPTFPITVAMRQGKLATQIDKTIWVGVAPTALSLSPSDLKAMGITGVVNMCDEFRGPVASYKELGIKELWLPTVDHFEPSVKDLTKAVDFIKDFKEKGQKVYVHCKAGHGRSASVAYCWLVSEDPNFEPEKISRQLSSQRKVRKNLHLQKNNQAFRIELLEKIKGQQGDRK